MCGILGGTNRNWKYQKAIDTIMHRGPDGNRVNCLNEVTMGFVRLSIIDLSDNGMQPMFDKTQNVAITYNGEIYGFNTLREELVCKGHVFRSSSDTEVILNAYMEWGDKFIDHIDGMFAIAIYDKRENKLLLYRDRVGIKPLYYYDDGKEFAFSSELKGIVSLLENMTLSIDNTAVFDYYNYLYIPEPKTMYKNVYKLEPGFRLEYDLNNNVIKSKSPYWKLAASEKLGVCTEEKVNRRNAETLRSLIEESVKKQLVADVPVGGFLSGGLDSSIITLEAMKYDTNYELFSIGFYDYKRNEIPYVEALEDYLGFKSNKYYLKRDEFQNLYNKMRDWYDEPFADTSGYPSYVVSREAKKKCKVILAGDGGDELFCGYPRYLNFNKMSKGGGINIDGDLENLYRSYLFQPYPDQNKLKQKLGISKDYDTYWFYRKYYVKDLPPATRVQYMDFHTYLPGDILTKIDRVSMAVSLEVRVPFLSKEIIEFVFGLPQEERTLGRGLKGLLKYAYESSLPQNLLDRRKNGFSIPYSFFGYNIMQQDRILNELFPELLSYAC